MTLEELDALNNVGLPQLHDKLKKDGNYYTFTKEEIKLIKNQIIDFDNYYLQGWKDSKTRKKLVEMIRDYCSTFRCYSLIIE